MIFFSMKDFRNKVNAKTYQSIAPSIIPTLLSSKPNKKKGKNTQKKPKRTR
ncbi:hypothetical protein [Tepidibacillus marianensis]|uniref:hypothetical protein n=1 Tax=Tepidibacillus marianensis TaxID=3131995 RepID=UPI0030D3706C